MKKTYKLSQVIFALRKEYLAVEHQLNILKENIILGKSISDVQIHIGTASDVYLFLEKKLNFIHNMIILLTQTDTPQYEFILSDKVQGKYFDGKEELCEVKNLEEVESIVNNIVSSQFVKTTFGDDLVFKYRGKTFTSILVNERGINLFKDVKHKYPSLYYDPKFDKLIVTDPINKVDAPAVYSILDTPIKASLLNQYYCRIIDNYQLPSIRIPNTFNKKSMDLYVCEEPQRLYLLPKNRL